ncbi:MAG: putative peptidoglycan glycosyltransferase FtsW [Patescibacteria group bacterium]
MVKRSLDYFLLAIVAILALMGVLILASVSAPFSQERFGHPYYYLVHQALFGLIPGGILALFFFKINLEKIKKIAPLLLLMNLALLAMVFLPIIGRTAGGSHSWLGIGPISFQPSEFLKLTFIIYLSSFLTSSRRSFPAFLIIVGLVSLLLIFQPDVGTLGIIVLTAILIYFSARTPIWHSVLVVLAGIGGLAALMKFSVYRFSRLTTFLHPTADPQGTGYQITQSVIAVGSGGLLGRGLGLAQEKFGLLPQPISDSIFVIFAKEAGFAGAIFLISFFLIFLWKGIKIAKKTKDPFYQLLAIGITSWIVLQAFINIGAIIGLLPLTGIPLPFISYGGSALTIELAGIGILLNISKQHT